MADAPTSPLEGAAWDATMADADERVEFRDLDVSVSNPQVTGGFMRKYVVYTVHTEAPYNFVVLRRFSHFCWLREALIARYIGLLVPPLPPKDFLGSTSANRAFRGSSDGNDDVSSRFVQARMRQLQMFLSHICQVPYLRDDRALHAFLSVQDDGEWDRAQREADEETKRLAAGLTASQPGQAPPTQPSLGLKLWRSMLGRARPSTNPEREIADVTRQLDKLQGTLYELQGAAAKLANDTYTAAASLGAFRDAAASLQETEESLGDAGVFEYPSRAAADLAQFLGLMAADLGSFISVQAFHAVGVECASQMVVEFLQNLAQALQDLIRMRQPHLRSVQSATRHASVHKAEAERRQATDSLPKQAAAAQAELQAALTRLQLFDAGLTFHCFPAFNVQRENLLRTCMGIMAITERQHAHRALRVWASTQESMGLDLEAHYAVARRLMPGEDLGDEPPALPAPPASAPSAAPNGH